MKINQTGSLTSSLSSSSESRNRANIHHTDTTSPGAKEVQLSALSASLQKAEAAMVNTPVVANDRVQEIRQAIAEGRFEVNPERIASGLLESVHDMLTSSKV